jgi:hypothetical protein
VRWLGAASDIAHPDLDGEYSVGWNQPTRLHPEESSLDARNPFTLPEHCLVVDEDATALQPEGVLGKTRLRLSFVERPSSPRLRKILTLYVTRSPRSANLPKPS